MIIGENKMKTYSMIIVLTILLTCSGCLEGLWKKKPKLPFMPQKHNTQKDIITAKKIIENSATSIENATDSITKEVETIQIETELVTDDIPDEARTESDKHLIKIEESSAKIAEDANEINSVTTKLTGATTILDVAGAKAADDKEAVKILEKERNAALEKAKQAKEELDSMMHRAIRWLVIACIVGAGIFGVIAVMYGSKIGIAGAACCGVILAIAVFVETYFVYLAIGGGVILAGLVGLVIYRIWMQKKALKETVDTVEVVKDNLSDETRTMLFGGEGETGIMDSIQSKTTIGLIKKEKEKIAKLWNYARVHKKPNGADGLTTNTETTINT